MRSAQFSFGKKYTRKIEHMGNYYTLNVTNGIKNWYYELFRAKNQLGTVFAVYLV
jgi:hypothetical protein